jgi:hypothetical protein
VCAWLALEGDVWSKQSAAEHNIKLAPLLDALPHGVDAVLAVATRIVEANATKTKAKRVGGRKISSVISRLKPKLSDLRKLRKFRDEVAAMPGLQEEVGSFIRSCKVDLEKKKAQKAKSSA